MTLDPRYGLIIRVPETVFTIWTAARGIPVVMVAAMWAAAAWNYLT